MKVEELVHKYQFQTVCNEDLDFFQQVALYSNAKFLISFHGAGLSNLIFMKKDSIILELHKKKTNDKDWHSLAYWYLADILDFAYYHQLCTPNDPKEQFMYADCEVDIPMLENNIKQMLELRLT